MKTILLSLLTVLAAQFSSGQKATFGIKGGMTLSNYTVKETYDNFTFIESSKTKIGPYFGGRVEFKISDKFFFNLNFYIINLEENQLMDMTFIF